MRHRRLIGPTIISLLLFGLLADHLFMSESRWSLSRFLGKIFSVFGAIVFHPALSPWISATVVPLLLVGLAVALLFLIVSGAKRAMTRVTPNVNTESFAATRKAPEVAVQIEPSRPSVISPRGHARRNRILSRWAWFFGSVALFFGIVICLIVFSLLGRAIERQSKNRAGVMSMGLGEIVAPALASGQFNDVRTAIERFATSNSLAYAYVEDAGGRIIAHWPRDLPRYLERSFPNSTERALRGMDIQYRGLGAYEAARRISDGKLGFIHVAISRQDIIAETYRYTTTIAALILILLFCIVGSFLLLSRSLLSPLTDLVEQAARLNEGDFEVALKLQRSDEFGDIALSLERLRSSLRFATARLDKGDISEFPGDLSRAPRPTRDR